MGDPTFWFRMAEAARSLQVMPKAVKENMAKRCLALIVSRTLDGYDKNGIEFEPYSTGKRGIGGDYLEYAQQSGGRPGTVMIDGARQPIIWFDNGYSQFKRGLGYARVNLMVSGKLLGEQGWTLPFAMVDETDTGFTIDFTDAEERKKAENHVDGTTAYRNDRILIVPEIKSIPIRDFWGVMIIDEENDDVMSVGNMWYQAAIDTAFAEVMQ